MTTALITGASAGLGEGFARRLAARDHDLVLVARRIDRLETLAAELHRAHGIGVRVIPLDLGISGAAVQLIAEVGVPDILVNNAGFGLASPFVEADAARLDQMVALNCTALMDLCRQVLPAMIARRSGQILNIASTAAFQPGPGLAVYAATKAFVLSLSEALHEEARPHNVTVATLCPGPTKTEFFDVAGAEKGMLHRIAGDPRAVIDAGLLALDGNKPTHIAGFANRLMVFLQRFVPRFAVRRVAARLL